MIHAAGIVISAFFFWCTSAGIYWLIGEFPRWKRHRMLWVLICLAISSITGILSVSPPIDPVKLNLVGSIGVATLASVDLLILMHMARTKQVDHPHKN